MIKTDVLSSVISDYLKKEEAYEGYRSLVHTEPL